MVRRTWPKFVHITCTAKSNVFALDEEGGVWRYVRAKPGPENEGKGKFAFWTKLTSHRSDPADAKIRE